MSRFKSNCTMRPSLLMNPPKSPLDGTKRVQLLEFVLADQTQVGSFVYINRPFTGYSEGMERKRVFILLAPLSPVYLGTK
jgi:hypothetical protein